MAPFSGEANIPGLAQLVEDLGLFVSDNALLRAKQAENAPQARVLSALVVAAGANAVKIPEAQGTDKYAFMLFLVETTSGAGRYDPGTGLPATATRGLEIPAGGAAIALDGSENIRQFSVFGAAAMQVTYVLFQ